jgi:hypothetical protein
VRSVYALLSWENLFDCKIELQDIDARFAEDAEAARRDVLCDESGYLLPWHATGFGDTYRSPRI